MELLDRLLGIIHVDRQISTSNEIKEGIELINITKDLNVKARETILACYENGPLFDGDVPSKQERDTLVDLELICKIIIKKEWGYNACTYKGGYVCKLLLSGLI